MSHTVSATAPIVLSYSHRGPGAPQEFREELRAAAERTAEVLREQGCSILIVDASAPGVRPAALMAQAAGLVVLGGADIDPACYDQELAADNLYYVDPAADRFEIELVREAVTRRIPVFGICRGSQILNVALGGTLIQDLGTGLHNHEITGNPWTDHEVVIESRSELREILAADALTVRTGHHQAVDVLGAGLRAAAHATDGVIEAVEHTESWAIGVQWHPEEAHGDPIALRRLFTGFAQAVSAARPLTAER